MEINSIYNENCISTLERMENNNGFDFIITSPPYNTNVKANAKNNTLTVNVKENQYTYARYDGYDDSRTNEEYCDFIANLFKQIKLKMRPNGCVLWNASYGNENADALFLSLTTMFCPVPIAHGDFRNIEYARIHHPKMYETMMIKHGLNAMLDKVRNTNGQMNLFSEDKQ